MARIIGDPDRHGGPRGRWGLPMRPPGCAQRAKRTAEQVDLLINAGVYNDKGTGRAIAALIEEDIGANPEQQPGTGQGTFSFEVRNGGCRCCWAFNWSMACRVGNDQAGDGDRRRH